MPRASAAFTCRMASAAGTVKAPRTAMATYWLGSPLSASSRRDALTIRPNQHSGIGLRIEIRLHPMAESVPSLEPKGR